MGLDCKQIYDILTFILFVLVYFHMFDCVSCELLEACDIHGDILLQLGCTSVTDIFFCDKQVVIGWFKCWCYFIGIHDMYTGIFVQDAGISTSISLTHLCLVTYLTFDRLSSGPVILLKITLE